MGKADVIFVGGGPVGLWTACQTKLLAPDTKIVVLEKNEVYKRSHILLMNPITFSRVPYVKKQEHRDHFYKLAKEFAFCKFIPTNVIEAKLRKLAKNMGIVIKTAHVTDMKALKKEYPKTRVFVGTDGAHSVVRKQIFKEALTAETKHSHLCTVKYQIKGKAKKLSFLDNARLQLKIGTVFSVFNGKKQKKGKTAVTLGITIDAETYKRMNHYTFKDPFILDQTKDSKFDKKTLKAVRLILNKRVSKLGEKRVKGSENITVIPIESYASKEVVHHGKKRTYCLAGDAASGFPFYRSLNKGMIEGTKLAKVIVRHQRNQKKHKKPIISPFTEYSAYVKFRTLQERFFAHVVGFFLNFTLPFVRIGHIFHKALS